MNEKQLSVRLYGIQVGILEQTSMGDLTFGYDPTAKQAISFSLPLREQVYHSKDCEAFFDGLLPESEKVKKIIGNRYGVSPNNIFSLLKVIGRDCAGAISFHSLSDPETGQDQVPLSGRIVSEDELYEHIRDLPKKPLFLDFDGLRFSLAGVQDKAAVCLIDNQIALPQNNCPTTHILKPAIPGYENTVENEYICLETAAQIGLSIPKKEIRKIKDINFLLIERYDRHIQNNFVKRIHQEDFCQALNIPSYRKYQSDGGPGFSDCFNLLNNTTTPVLGRTMLASAVVYNYLIGNMDAHGKNFSLLYQNDSQFGLSPFYDIVCTLFYPNLSTKMAMKIGSCYKAMDVYPRHWEDLCHKVGYSYPALKRLIYTQSEAMMKSLDSSREFYVELTRDHAFVDKFIEFINENISRTLKNFEMV